MVTYTKAEDEILDWTLLDDILTDSPSCETTVQTKDTELSVGIIVTVAHADTNNAAANYVTGKVMVKLGADNEGWRQFMKFQAGGGQATGVTLAANSGLGQANPERLEVASTADWDTGLGELLFLKDTGTLVNSCLVVIDGWVDNDYYIANDGLVNAYDNADVLYNGVDQIPIRIPAEYQYFKILFHNSDSAATYAVRVDYGEVQSIA